MKFQNNFRVILKRKNRNSWTEAFVWIFPQNHWFLANFWPVSVKFIQLSQCYFILFGQAIFCKSRENMNIHVKRVIFHKLFFPKRSLWYHHHHLHVRRRTHYYFYIHHIIHHRRRLLLSEIAWGWGRIGLIRTQDRSVTSANGMRKHEYSVV